MPYYDSKLRVNFNAPLNEQDAPEQTKGCRANNPDICGYAFVEKVCAFCRVDGICKHPSRAWKSQYRKLAAQNKCSQNNK